MASSVGKAVGRVISVLIVLALISGGIFAYLHKQEISDHFAAQGFTPSSEIIALTAGLELTSTGERIFLATHPTLDASQRFNEQCAGVDHAEGSHILGCYVRDSIHLFQVVDERLLGIVEVTAAHELLHAAYARMSDRERQRLAGQLNELYEDLAEQDPELAGRMSLYSELSAAGFANELHSVLGTEVRELPVWAEEHYARWFENRGVILDHFDAYHAIFAEIQERAQSLQSEMTELREDVEARRTEYESGVVQFNLDVEEFNRRNAAFEFDGNEGEFWQLRWELEGRAVALNDERDAIQADIERYETMRQELAELSATSEELNQHLDSLHAPPVSAG